MPKKYYLTLLIAAFTLTTIAVADPVPTINKPCQIELIIFKYNNSQIPFSAWQDYNPAQTFSKALQLQLYDPMRPKAFLHSLLPSDFILKREAQHLQQQGNYQILAHISWIQRLPQPRNAKFIHITGGNMLGPEGQIWELNGTVAFSQTNYINLQTNLELTELTNNGLKSFYLQQSKRMRPQELNYLDNPVFAMLVKVKSI